MAQGLLKPTLNNLLSQNASQGSFFRLISTTGGANAKSVASSTCGYVNGMRFPDPLVLPASFGTGVTGCVPTQILMTSGGSTSGGVLVAGLEVLLGSIDLNGGAFTDGSAMPTRSIIGANNPIASAAMMVIAVQRTVATGTPTIAITYKNQAGTGSRTANMTLPASTVALSAFQVMPHFQGTDTGIQDITNITKSAGTAGIIDIYGIIPQAVDASAGLQEGATEIISSPLPLVSLQPSDTLGLYIFSDVVIPANTSGLLLFSGVADN